ncbi:response regulator [Desulfatitalea tepidiphila]|uniref:response regulator n=1 Tax=Desulfatitalea tepidiphila TaxID=1185843 RepID=UPI0006B48B24|nr:response regulator [Desulfatitalea tepidiphila]
MNRYRILIVDDEQAIRDALKEWLEMNGYEVTLAMGAEDVIWLSDWQWQGFECIVTGINQPGLNGLEFTSLVKSCDGPPVVVMTGYQPEEVRPIACKFGAAAFMKKPFNLDDFLEIINDCCQKRH